MANATHAPDADRRVEVPVSLLRTIIYHVSQPRILAQDRNMIVERINALIDPKFDFEVNPTRHLPQGDGIEVCDEKDAGQWSVYKRPRYSPDGTPRLAMWVADCQERKVAECLRDALQQQQDGGK